MLAKLRAASGSVCKSWLLITPWCTTLTRSIGWLVIDEFCPCTETVSAGAANLSVTVTSRTELTAIETFASAGANPVALAAT